MTLNHNFGFIKPRRIQSVYQARLNHNRFGYGVIAEGGGSSDNRTRDIDHTGCKDVVLSTFNP